ncbi:MAG: hypothetical protein ACTHKL_24800, partial [Streptosporangiaceae bacterium]
MRKSESEAVRDHIEALQQQVIALRQSVEQARQESSQKITARVKQARESLNRQSGSDSDVSQSQNPWQAIKSQAAAKMRDLHDHIDRTKGEVRADIADDDASFAEAAAVDTLD